MIQYIVGIIALVMIFIFVVRPILRWISAIEPSLTSPDALTAGAEGLALPGAMPGAAGLLAEPEELLDRSQEEIQIEEANKTYEQISDFVSNNPDQAADLLRNWVRESPARI
jgi:flagellar biosynthesis/type III secretory pathway M-ring protein FliF/YscJ